MSEDNDLTHGRMVPLDPPGSEPRRWTCLHCGDVGESAAVLNQKRCANSRLLTGAEVVAVIVGGES